MSEQSDSTMAAFLKDHPRLMGYLFALSVFFTTYVAPVLADGGNGGSGGP